MLPRILSLALMSSLAAAWAAAPPFLPPAPPPPVPTDSFNIFLRYRIVAARPDRVRQFNEMALSLRTAGLVRTDNPAEGEAADVRASTIEGKLPAAGIPKAIRQRHVRSILAWPEASRLPDEAALVRIDVYLETGYSPSVQRRFAEETRDALAKLGFIEAFGYDTQKETRLVGGLRAGKLREAMSVTRHVRVIMARPDQEVPARRREPGKLPEGQEKLSPDLRKLLAAGGDTLARLEVILAKTPGRHDEDWVEAVEQGGAAAEGIVGPLATVRCIPKEAATKIAAQPEVIAVRLPRPARTASSIVGDAPPKWSALRRSGLVELHEKGRKGRGQRIALIGDDFAGWQELPGSRTLFDVTALRNKDLIADPFPSAGKGQGAGTRHARLLLAAAPDSDLVLIRIDPAAPYMLQLVARAINGEMPKSPLLARRFRELQDDRDANTVRASRVRRLRLDYLDDPREDEAGLKRKADYEAAQKQYDTFESEIRRRTLRWLALSRLLRELKGIPVVASTLVWSDGFPVDGSSALSRYFDDTPFKAALWFQAAGDTRGQAWGGPWLDEDGNGRHEFPDTRRKEDWTREIAWLSWQAPDGKKASAIPKGATLRLVLTWKEAHDPLPLKVGEDPYREPLAKLGLVVVHQPDPSGKSRPRDDLEVVAQTVGTAVRLEQSLHAATYEITVEVQADRPGRYGVLIEGKVPDTISPPGEVSLPGTRKSSEVNIRLFVDSEGARGRPILDGLPATASLGMPADSRRVLTVGAAQADGEPRPDSSSGVMGAVLAAKPDLTAYGVGGTAEAAAFAAGFAATASGAWGSLAAVEGPIRREPGRLLRVPPPARRPR